MGKSRKAFVTAVAAAAAAAADAASLPARVFCTHRPAERVVISFV